MFDRKKVLILYSPELVTSFVKDVISAISPDVVVYLEGIKKENREYADSYIELGLERVNFRNANNSIFFTLDTLSVPINCIVNSIPSSNKCVFIQHGSIKGAQWEIDSGLKRNFWRRLKKRIGISLKLTLATRGFGIRFMRERRIDVRLFDSVFLFIAEDAIFFESFEGELLIGKSEIARKIRSDVQGENILISQPFVEDEILSEEQYMHSVGVIIERYNISRIILHPKENGRKFSIYGESVNTSYFSEVDTLDVNAVYGFYSSVLEEIEGVPVIYIDLQTTKVARTKQPTEPVGRPYLMKVLKEKFQ
ncbi:glycosyltransferase family 52 [Maritalea mediterranea]|uniref:Uncharacterized protein n=1 Tax=Maritalea mediterranea TaxID=2909667 RepID=A0ABS9E937_9HYPH|nr:glycosyltransferase family 52 [Maritalea mediterranea]MCF4098414.1 hypothetical protein [Maritalea mediterranea]